ncbi:MAG: hypothetical protein RL885_12850 [Planctomycetota bacterium]
MSSRTDDFGVRWKKRNKGRLDISIEPARDVVNVLAKTKSVRVKRFELVEPGHLRVVVKERRGRPRRVRLKIVFADEPSAQGPPVTAEEAFAAKAEELRCEIAGATEQEELLLRSRLFFLGIDAGSYPKALIEQGRVASLDRVLDLEQFLKSQIIRRAAIEGSWVRPGEATWASALWAEELIWTSFRRAFGEPGDEASSLAISRALYLFASGQLGTGVDASPVTLSGYPNSPQFLCLAELVLMMLADERFEAHPRLALWTRCLPALIGSAEVVFDCFTKPDVGRRYCAGLDYSFQLPEAPRSFEELEQHRRSLETLDPAALTARFVELVKDKFRDTVRAVQSGRYECTAVRR